MSKKLGFGHNPVPRVRHCQSQFVRFKDGRLKSLSAVNLSKIASYFNVSINYLMGEDSRAEEKMLKAALFGGDGVVTDEMWNEVKRYAQYVKERENGN